MPHLPVNKSSYLHRPFSFTGQNSGTQLARPEVQCVRDEKFAPFRMIHHKSISLIILSNSASPSLLLLLLADSTGGREGVLLVPSLTLVRASGETGDSLFALLLGFFLVAAELRFPLPLEPRLFCTLLPALAWSV